MFGITHEWIFVFGQDRKNLNRTVANNVEANEKRNKHKQAGNGKIIVNARKKDGSFSEGSSPTYLHKQLNTVYDCQPQMARDEFTTKHTAPFPVKFPFGYIEAMTSEKDIVIDPFTGSGTTMVASHQLNRKCYGMEIDCKYMEVIVQRMIKLDKTLVIKRNGIEETQKWLDKLSIT